MKINNIIKGSLSIFLLFICLSCSKYLSIKPNKALSTPSTVADLQGIIDNNSTMNWKGAEISEVACDNYYLTDAGFASLRLDGYRKAYLWQPKMFIGITNNDWSLEYNIVYNANVVLDGLQNIQRDSSNAIAWDNCKGSALVFRAKSFYEIAQIWTEAYDSSSAKTDLGIPLRLTSDFNVHSVRASEQKTYEQIISDLKKAVPLLPSLATFPFRPSKCAAYGLLARTYLTIGAFRKAKQYADSCLQIDNALMNYNNLDSAASYPIQKFNIEDIMDSWCVNDHDLDQYTARIDTTLYYSYAPNDLRKVIFYYKNDDGTVAYKGSYMGNDARYNGVAADEIYLIRAECNARMGNTSEAMNDLNMLLLNRWKTGTFIPFTATSATDALNKILIERRKELVMRMLRFTDIKRLNKEGRKIVLKRIINGKTYILPANDPRYALPIPDEVIDLTGMRQN